MAHAPSRMRQIMDWRAALIAGVIAGIVFLAIPIIAFPPLTGGSPWTILHQIAAILLGEEVLIPSAALNVRVLVVALLIHFTLSIVFTLILAFIIHRWGLAVGIIGGALFGLALYLVNFFTLTIFFPWFFGIRSWPIILAHVIFGATAGGVYEALEQDIYVPVESS